ncbi:NAD dependent epimerase/dehydratase family protein [Bacteroidales bacterium KA00344]|nr:NAD dependent epimerase/dehydratase family protein [Bacteroidales bacterium KA00344]
MKILITGASGFIGSFMVEEALRQGFETWAGVRHTSSRQYLQDDRIHFIELDFSSEEALIKQLTGQEFDYIVHAAGATKCLHAEDFFKINYEGTVNFVHAILKLRMPLKRFIYISTLGVYGAIHEQRPYQEIEQDDTPRPNTAYGRSKLKTERFLDSIGNDFNYIVLRPTGVYGPREKDYFLIAKSIKRHIDFSVGFKPQDITFVYVKDVVQAVFLALDRGMSGRKYFLSDGNVYRSCTFSDYIRQELGNPWWIRITAPIWLLRIVTFCGEHFSRITGKPTPLNNDKYNILKQRNWRCNIEPTCDELGYHPRYQLQEGVKETMAWYKENNWL